VSVRDAREVSEETSEDRVIQLVSLVARPCDSGIPLRVSDAYAADPVSGLDEHGPAVGGDADNYLSTFQVWGAGVHRANFPAGLWWWGVEYDGTQTIVRIYPLDPTGGSVAPISQGSLTGRGGRVNLSEVGGSGVYASVDVASTVVTDDEDAANTLAFYDWYLDRVFLGDCCGRIGLYLFVSGFTDFTHADITPIVLSPEGNVVTRLETKRFERGAVDFATPWDYILLPVQWWEVQGIHSIAAHITEIGGGGGVLPQMIRG